MRRLRYENEGSLISIKLNDDYTILALIKEVGGNEYQADLYIKGNDTDFIDTAKETLTYGGCDLRFGDIKKHFTEVVSDMYNDGDLDGAIDNYEYEIKCCCYGIDNLEISE